MSLQDWQRNGWLVEQRSSPEEIANLPLQLATAALAAAGFRASREQHHYRVAHSLAFTVGADAQLIRRLDAFRRKRNISDYERAGAVSAGEAEEMRELAVELRELVSSWLRQRHPDLLDP